MCHNSVIEENDQIDKCVENGMPRKIVKSLQFTIRKRIEQHEKNKNTYGRISNLNTNYINNNDTNNDQDHHYNNDENNREISIIEDNRIRKNLFMEQTSNGTVTTITDGIQKSRSCNKNQEIEEEILNRPPLQGCEEIKTNGTGSLCGRLRSRVPTNITKGDDMQNIRAFHVNNTSAYNDDHMAKSVRFFRKCVSHAHHKLQHLMNNKIYIFLTTTTQPAHIITIAIVSFVLLVIWPDLIGWRNIVNHNHAAVNQANENLLKPTPKITPNKFAIVIYLGSFATHFGAQIWMTFVSGLSLYFSLPRHLFGQCQQILFPKYFTLNAILSIIMLILFVKYFLIVWTTTKVIQIAALSITATIEIVVRLYLAPTLLKLMIQKYRIEDSIGSGTEIGSLVQGDLIQCPHYQRIHGAFRRLHMTVAIGNIIALTASCTHLCYLAAQIQIAI